MTCCTVCGMETSVEAICSFCKMRGSGKTLDGRLLERLIASALRRVYHENVRQPDPIPECPQNITIPQSQIDDILRLNVFLKDVLAIRYPKDKYPPGTQFATLRLMSEDTIDDVSLVLKSKKRDDPRALPVIIDKEWTRNYWNVLNFIEHTYGGVILRWFETKPERDWKRERMLLYINLWQLGNLYRHGRPAISTSPWLTGERRPIKGDPFGDVAVGKE